MSRLTKMLLALAIGAVIGFPTGLWAYTRIGSAARPLASTQKEADPTPRTITVIGAGEISLRPDIATINVGAEARSDRVSEAKSEVDEQMKAILAALEEAGVAKEDIRTSHYSIYYDQQPMPMIGESAAQESPVAYRVSNMVQVTVRDVEKAGDVLDAVVQAGANQVYGVTFTVSDEGTWESEARTKAMADARERAGELARLAGAELGEVLSVSEVIGGIPTTVMGVKVERGMGGGGIAPGELELSTQIQVAFAIE
jgi:uncharacterized protein YggE